jgi:hypothetical protein
VAGHVGLELRNVAANYPLNDDLACGQLAANAEFVGKERFTAIHRRLISDSIAKTGLEAAAWRSGPSIELTAWL